MNSVTRQVIADHLVRRLEQTRSAAKAAFHTEGLIRSCQITEVLPVDLANAIFDRFPSSERMTFKRSIKERKHVAAQMDTFDPLLEEAVYAFQDPRVVDLISDITSIQDLEPDVDLYAGGISAMSQGAYLRPHLDNSHDKDQKRYRALNLLYYVTPNWREEYGGCFQLWDNGPTGSPRTLPPFFNSLVIVATGRDSWHSVNEIVYGDAPRCCVSNYYFSRRSPEKTNYFHCTSFRSEYGKGALDLVMRADNALRTTILKVAGGLYKNPHVYKRKSI